MPRKGERADRNNKIYDAIKESGDTNFEGIEKSLRIKKISYSRRTIHYGLHDLIDGQRIIRKSRGIYRTAEYDERVKMLDRAMRILLDDEKYLAAYHDSVRGWVKSFYNISELQEGQFISKTVNILAEKAARALQVWVGINQPRYEIPAEVGQKVVDGSWSTMQLLLKSLPVEPKERSKTALTLLINFDYGAPGAHLLLMMAKASEEERVTIMNFLKAIERLAKTGPPTGCPDCGIYYQRWLKKNEETYPNYSSIVRKDAKEITSGKEWALKYFWFMTNFYYWARHLLLDHKMPDYPELKIVDWHRHEAIVDAVRVILTEIIQQLYDVAEASIRQRLAVIEEELKRRRRK